MSRRRRRRERRQRRQAYINFAIIALLIAGAFGAYQLIKPPPYDERTLCVISDEMPPHTAIILDKTDEYDAEQADLIADLIRRTRERLDVGERLTIFELDAEGQFDPRGEFSLCNPGRGAQVNPLFRNPRMIEERYETLFEAPMDAVLDDLVTPKEAPSSPIMEAIARLAQTEYFSDDVPARRIVIVSDMLQNSDLFTAYGGAGQMPDDMPETQAVSEAVEDRFGRNLRGVELEIRLIPRGQYTDMQRGALREYWDDILSDLGVATDWRDL